GPDGARAARRQATQIDLARRRAARSRAIHSAYPKGVPRVSPWPHRGIPTQLDRHGLRSAKLLPGAARPARQPHRAVGRRPSSKGKGLKKAEENSALLRENLWAI